MFKLKDKVKLQDLDKYGWYYDEEQKATFKDIENDLEWLLPNLFMITMYIKDEDRLVKGYTGVEALDYSVMKSDIQELIDDDLIEIKEIEINGEIY